jgi:hypothetical protein
MLVRAALPCLIIIIFFKPHKIRVCYSQEALPDVNHASNKISEDIRLRIVNLHKAGKGYKRISKSLDVHQSSVRQIV